MIARNDLANIIRRAALRELGPDDFGRACVVLSSLAARLFAEVRGERLCIINGVGGGARHAWCEDVHGHVYDLQPNPPLVAARPPVDYLPLPLTPFDARFFAELAESFAGLRHSPHIAGANEVAQRIRAAALADIARHGDAETVERLFFGLGRDGLRAVEIGRPELVEAVRQAVRGQRALQSAGLDESAGALPWYCMAL